MNPVPTSVSLLDRLKLARPDASDWGRLQGIYLPLIRRWLARVPGLGDEADDLAQDVFLVVARELPRFERRREGSFRTWLRKMTVNKALSHWRRRRRLAIVQPDFHPTTWAAIQRVAVDGLPAARVAEELGLSENAVLQAKSRILKRLRQEAGDLLK
jgi:RNA polymerase sigma-70 factor (ECF subfamily)